MKKILNLNGIVEFVNLGSLPNDGKVIDDILELDPMAEMFVFGCTVDYVKELGGNYLTVKNPNATASCGCGESFAV